MTTPSLRGLLASAYELDKQPARAINEYNRAILLDPYEEAYYFQLSQLLIDRENFATARQVLEAARKIFDKSPEIELALGTAYYGLKNYDEAGFAFLKTVTLAPQAPQAYTFLASACSTRTRSGCPRSPPPSHRSRRPSPASTCPSSYTVKRCFWQARTWPERKPACGNLLPWKMVFGNPHYQLGILSAKAASASPGRSGIKEKCGARAHESVAASTTRASLRPDGQAG